VRHVAFCLLAAALLAGCGGSGGSEWPGPSQPAADGRVAVDGFDEAASSPEALAAAFLRLDERRAARISLVTTEAAEGATRATVVATLDGLLDDSVEAVRYVLAVTKEEAGWRLESVRGTQRCRAGRGHRRFSADACI
jgi:non-ribosomal peptide synthetase component F